MPDRQAASGAPLAALIREAVESGQFTALVGLVATASEVLWRGSAGTTGPESTQQVDCDALFDLASLTKTFTGGLALALSEAGDLPLDLPVGELFTGAPAVLAPRPLSDLLRQRAGFVPWTPLWVRSQGREEARELLLEGSLLGADPGTYSDLSFILWGMAAEEATGTPLDELFRDRLLDPLGLRDVRMHQAVLGQVVPCLVDGAKEAELAERQGITMTPLPPPSPGEPQDGNARFLAGRSAHAGLAGSAESLWKWASSWLDLQGPLSLESRSEALAGEGPFLLGWARPKAWARSTEGLPASAFGALGFVGGSLWIDAEADRIALLLGHRSSALSSLSSLRSAFHARALML